MVGDVGFDVIDTYFVVDLLEMFDGVAVVGFSGRVVV